MAGMMGTLRHRGCPEGCGGYVDGRQWHDGQFQNQQLGNIRCVSMARQGCVSK